MPKIICVHPLYIDREIFVPLRAANDRALMNELRYSRRNRTDILTSNEALKSLAEQLAIEFIESRDGGLRRRYSQAQEADCFQHFELILVDLFTAYKADPRLYIGYSRGMNAYKRGGAYWDYEKDRSSISKTYYLDAIDNLNEVGLIEHHAANPGYGLISSRMRAAPRLAEVYEETEATWVSIVADLDAPHVIVKDKNKKPVRYPDPGDFDLERAIGNLRRINENLQSTFINFNISDLAHNELKRRFSGVLDDDEGDVVGEVREPFDFTNRTLKRIFAEGTFEKGGRFYGGWWQGVPSEYRKHIEIDGKITVEMDYATMQPTIFYAQAGVERPIDSYTLDGWPQEKSFRKLVKKLFSQLVNSDPTSRNPNQWHRFAPQGLTQAHDEREPLSPHEKRIRERAAFRELYGADYNELIVSLLEFHEPIKDAFFSKSWGRMQRIDSDIAESVMLKLLRQDVSITLLPIHDSFIVRRGAENILKEAMSEAFEETVGAMAGIDRDEAIFDPPEDYNNEIGLVFGEDLYRLSKEHVETHSSYHRREQEWIMQHGPID